MPLLGESFVLHTCKPPVATLDAWLTATSSGSGNYGHLLLEAKQPGSVSLAAALRPYFESAHLDAREVFHGEAGLDLHPDASSGAIDIQYPLCLPKAARHGIFGEALAGLVIESYPAVGGHKWTVPVFLFRYHADVEKYVFGLARDRTKTRQLWGRFGEDFIGISIGSDGVVQRIVAGEAKWRDPISKTKVEDLLLGSRTEEPTGSKKYVRKNDGIWRSLASAQPVPHGLRQLQKILLERRPEEFAETILSIDKILALKGPRLVPRTDFVLLAGNSPAKRNPGEANVVQISRPAECAASRDLQIAEVFLRDGDELIKNLYDTLWT